MESKKHIHHHKSCDLRSRKIFNNDDLFKRPPALNIKQCNSDHASPWLSDNQNTRMRKHELHNAYFQSKPILTHFYHCQGDSNNVTKNTYAQTECTRHKTQPLQHSRNLETCTGHELKTFNSSKLSKKTKYFEHQQYTPAMYHMKDNNLTELPKNVTFHVTGEPQDNILCPKSIYKKRQFLTIHKSPNVQGPVIKFITLKKTHIISNKKNNMKDKVNKKQQHRSNKTKSLSLLKHVNSSNFHCHANKSHLQGPFVEDINRHLDSRKFQKQLFCNVTKKKSAKTYNGKEFNNVNSKFISKNYIKEELDRKRNFSAIFIGSVCVVGKKLTMWKKIKDRTKSQSCPPSQESVARYKEKKLDNSVYDKVNSIPKSSDPVESPFGKHFVCRRVHVCNCKSDMTTPAVESVSAGENDSRIVREFNHNIYSETIAVDHSDAYYEKPFYKIDQKDVTQQCDQFPNMEGFQDLCKCANSWLRLSCSANSFLTHLRMKGKEIAKCILGLRQTISASIQTEKVLNSMGIQKWCEDITDNDDKLNYLTRSVSLSEECIKDLPCDECSKQEYDLRNGAKKVSCKINERIRRRCCGINVRERTKMSRDTGVMSGNHDTGCRNKKISCDVDRRYKKVEVSKTYKDLGIHKAEKTFAEKSISCNINSMKDEIYAKKPYTSSKHFRIASKKDKSMTTVSINSSDMKSYSKQELTKNAVVSSDIKIIKTENVNDTDAASIKIEVPGIKVHKNKRDFEQKRKEVTGGTSDLQFSQSNRIIQPRQTLKSNTNKKTAKSLLKNALLWTLRKRSTRVRHTRLTKSVSVQYHIDLSKIPADLQGDIEHIGCGDAECKTTAIKYTTSDKCENKRSNKCCSACPAKQSQSCWTCAPGQKDCATIIKPSYSNIRFSNKCMQKYFHCKKISRNCQTNDCKINTCNKSIQFSPTKCRDVASHCNDLNSLCKPKPRRPSEICAKHIVKCLETDRPLKAKTCQGSYFQCINYDSLCIPESRNQCKKCLLSDKLYTQTKKNKSIFSQTNVPKPCTCVVELLKNQYSPQNKIKTAVQCRRVEIVPNSPCNNQVEVLQCPGLQDLKCGLPSCKQTETCSLQNIKELITQNPKKCSDHCPHRDEIDHVDPNKIFIHTLRKKPYLSVYRKFPWFYPQFLALLQIWKQFKHILLFSLAICVWTPCILFVELCRKCVCCAFS